MRKLSSMQKKLLKLAAQEYKRIHNQLPFSVDDFDYSKVICPIININAYENSDYDMNRFLSDMFFEERNK